MHICSDHHTSGAAYASAEMGNRPLLPNANPNPPSPHDLTALSTFGEWLVLCFGDVPTESVADLLYGEVHASAIKKRPAFASNQPCDLVYM